jgi:hypothetical protein
VHDRLSEQIATLPSLNKTQLLAIWAENFSKDPPPNLRKELMVPILAYRIQEREFGGLSHTARRRLREVAVSLMTDKPSRERSDSAPQTGTRLLSMWRGEMHEVIATGNGYLYRGQTCSSLSKIARELQGLGGQDLSSLGRGSHDCSSPLRRLYLQILRRRPGAVHQFAG